jgi:hypothetical protein
MLKVGHDHLVKTIQSSCLPSKLQKIIINLLINNCNQVQSGFKKTKSIKINNGVLQGSPSTDHILEKLRENDLAHEYGLSLDENQKPVSVLGFADDTVLVAKNKISAEVLLQLTNHRFNKIGNKFV